VRLFISYSRRDGEFVDGLVGELERRGHEVWVDTDDIRGRESWRGSIVAGITSADGVILVVSPASMQSANVEREMTVAAEQRRRIVPAVLQPAPFPPALQYELAGVQHVELADRPVADAVDELEAALGPAGPGRASTPSASPASPPARSRSWRSVALVAVPVAAAVVVALLLLGGNGDPDDDVVGGVDDAPATSDRWSTSGASAPLELDATVWFAGFEITATGARYDASSQDVQVDVQVTNTQRASADLYAVVAPGALVADGQRLTLYCTACSTLPPGTTTSDVFTADVASGLTLAEASLVFGGDEQHQATIPLDGGPATSERPLDVGASGTVDDTEASTFTVEQVEVVPAGCSGFAQELGFVPGRRDEVSVVVVGTAESYSQYPVNLGQATLTTPDGQVYASLSLSDNVVGLQPGQPVRDIAACFVVPAPASGEYLFAVRATGVDTNPEPVTITL